MSVVRAKLGEGGRLVVPAQMRKELGLEPGDDVILETARGELRVRSLRDAILRAQRLVQKYVPENVLLSEKLIAERRQEATRE